MDWNRKLDLSDSQKTKVFLWFFLCLMSAENTGKFLRKSLYEMPDKLPWSFYHFIKIVKKLLTSNSLPCLHVYCQRIKKRLCRFTIWFSLTLESDYIHSALFIVHFLSFIVHWYRSSSCMRDSLWLDQVF